MNNIFFTVVILAFNRPDKLKKALDSVAAQSFKDFEVLVVDAGNKNSSEDTCRQHELAPRYFYVEDSGIGMARDFGLRAAKGGWVAYLDDDDEYLHNHLEVRFEIIKNNPEVELFYNGFKTIGPTEVPDLLNPGKFLHVDDPVIYHAGTAVMKTRAAIKAGGYKGIEFEKYPDNFLHVAKEVGMKTFRIVEPRTYIYNRSEISYTGKLAKEYKEKD